MEFQNCWQSKLKLKSGRIGNASRLCRARLFAQFDQSMSQRQKADRRTAEGGAKSKQCTAVLPRMPCVPVWITHCDKQFVYTDRQNYRHSEAYISTYVHKYRETICILVGSFRLCAYFDNRWTADISRANKWQPNRHLVSFRVPSFKKIITLKNMFSRFKTVVTA